MPFSFFRRCLCHDWIARHVNCYLVAVMSFSWSNAIYINASQIQSSLRLLVLGVMEACLILTDSDIHPTRSSISWFLRIATWPFSANQCWVATPVTELIYTPLRIFVGNESARRTVQMLNSLVRNLVLLWPSSRLIHQPKSPISPTAVFPIVSLDPIFFVYPGFFSLLPFDVLYCIE